MKEVNDTNLQQQCCQSNLRWTRFGWPAITLDKWGVTAILRALGFGTAYPLQNKSKVIGGTLVFSGPKFPSLMDGDLPYVCKHV